MEKKIISVILSIVLLLALGMNAIAAGTEGSITISNTKDGKLYDLYRIFDLTYSEVGGDKKASYTIATDWEGFFAGAGAAYLVDAAGADALPPITVGTSTKYISVTESNVSEFAKAALEYAAQKTPDKTVQGDGGNVVVENLPLGYYLVYPEGATEITQGNGSICSLTSTMPDATVSIKAEYPSIDKEITDIGKVNTAAVGDEVPFTVTGKVPDMTGYASYIYNVVDTLSKGLTFNNDVEIEIDGAALEKDVDFTVDSATQPNGETLVKIVFKNFINHAADAGKTITITYSATLNEQAEIGAASNTNEVQLIYSNDPKNSGNGDEPDADTPTGESPKIKTETFTTKLQLNKVDGKNQEALAGAKFELTGTSANVTLVNGTIFEKADAGTYYMLKDGTFTTEAPTGDETHDAVYDSTTQKYSKVEGVNKNTDSTNINRAAYVDADGHLLFAGLGEGTYTITELVAPAGYNMLAAPITVTVSFDEATKTWSATGAALDGDTLKITVENLSGSALPETGGIGTTIFYVVGGILMAAAFVALVVRKKMKNVK